MVTDSTLLMYSYQHQMRTKTKGKNVRLLK